MSKAELKQLFSIEIAGKEKYPFLQIFGLTARDLFQALELVRMDCQMDHTTNYSIYTVGLLAKPSSKMLLDISADPEKLGIWYKSAKIFYGNEEDEIYIKPEGCYFDGANLQESMSKVKRGYCKYPYENNNVVLINANKNEMLSLFENFIENIEEDTIKIVFNVDHEGVSLVPGFYSALTDKDTLKEYLAEHHLFLFNDGFISFGIVDQQNKRQLLINEHKYLEYTESQDDGYLKVLSDDHLLKEIEQKDFKTIIDFNHIHMILPAKIDDYEAFYTKISDTFELVAE
jgi:hypothetical protein